MPILRRRNILMYLGWAFDAELASAEHLLILMYLGVTLDAELASAEHRDVSRLGL